MSKVKNILICDDNEAVHYFTRKLIKPLTEMAEVSNSMASGECF